MYSFEHSPGAEELASRYLTEKVTPARCAELLASGKADLGLIPVAAYASIPGLAIVPGVTVASLHTIRSLLLVFPSSSPVHAHSYSDAMLTPLLPDIQAIRSVALDTSSRTTALYTQILFRKHWLGSPTFAPHPPDLDAMLASADAAVLIGDPALHALEDRAARLERTGQQLHYLDLANAWHTYTNYPWVSAVWAARTQALTAATSAQLVEDLTRSRDQGMAHLPELADEWSTRLNLPRATVLAYLSKDIHYHLDPDCLAGIHRFFSDATECGFIDQAPALGFL